jgi:hypothetical protein
MEFYTFDSVNLVLPDVTGTLDLSADEASWLLRFGSEAPQFSPSLDSLTQGVPMEDWQHQTRHAISERTGRDLRSIT